MLCAARRLQSRIDFLPRYRIYPAHQQQRVQSNSLCTPSSGLVRGRLSFSDHHLLAQRGFICLSSVRSAQPHESHLWPRWLGHSFARSSHCVAAMSAPLFSQPSASKEELQNACSFVQSECNLHRRPYDMFSVLSGGLRPLYSGSSTESDLLTSINSLLSPPSPHDVSWNRQPGARYVPVAQEAFFKCGGLESLVASLRYPSAVNKPAICRYS